MASESRQTIIIRVKTHTKWAAQRAAKADRQTLTDYIIGLINRDQIERNANDSRKEPRA